MNVQRNKLKMIDKSMRLKDKAWILAKFDKIPLTN